MNRNDSKKVFTPYFHCLNLGGNILSAMAEAVENADFIIFLVSEKYKDSQSCRSGNYHLNILLI